MRSDFKSIEVKLSQAAGTELAVERYREKYVQVSEATAQAINATVVVQASMDKVTWFDIGTATNAAALISVPQTVKWIRTKTTAYVSGVLIGIFGGFDSRSF